MAPCFTKNARLLIRHPHTAAGCGLKSPAASLPFERQHPQIKNGFIDALSYKSSGADRRCRSTPVSSTWVELDEDHSESVGQGSGQRPAAATLAATALGTVMIANQLDLNNWQRLEEDKSVDAPQESQTNHSATSNATEQPTLPVEPPPVERTPLVPSPLPTLSPKASEGGYSSGQPKHVTTADTEQPKLPVDFPSAPSIVDRGQITESISCVLLCFEKHTQGRHAGYIFVYMTTYIHTYIPTYLHTYIPTYLHTYIPTCVYIYIYMYYIYNIYIYIYIYIFRYSGRHYWFP